MIGQKLKTIVPVYIADDVTWEEGTEVEVVQEYENGFGFEIQIQDQGGVVASFAICDVRGDHRWFDPA